MILVPKKESLAHFQSVAQQKSDRQAIAKKINLTSEEVNFLNEHPIIRVQNEMDWPPFDYNENGVPKGLSIDHMNLLAEKAGITIKYISGPTWNEFMEMLKSKDVDVIVNLIRTKDRLKYTLFTEPFFVNPTVIVSQTKNKYQMIEQLTGKTVAFPQGFFYEEVLRDNYPQINRLPVKNSMASIEAVSSGEADAALDENVVIKYLINKHMITDLAVSGEVKIGDPDIVNIRLGVRKDWPHLQSILNKAMNKISAQEMIELRKKWLSSHTSVSEKVPLTQEEQQWLVSHPIIRLGDDFSWPPFSFLDSEGRYAGASSSYAELLSERLGFELIPEIDLTWSQTLEKAKNKEIDFLPALAKTAEREKYLNFTKPYVSHPIVIATRKDYKTVGDLTDLFGARVGVVKDYMTESLLAERYPDLMVVTYVSVAEGLQALNEKQIDAFVDNLSSITWEIDKSKLEILKIAATTNHQFELAVAVRKDWPEFIPILEKALNTISKEEHDAIKNTWFRVTVAYGWDLKEILIYVLPIGLTGIAIAIIIIFWNRRLGKEITARKEIHTELTDMKQMLDLALEASNTGIWKYDLDPSGPKNVYMSEQWYKQVGYTPEDFEEGADVFGMLIHPDDQETVNQALDEHTAGRTDFYEAEFRLKAKDGSWKWIHAKGQIIEFDDNQDPKFMNGANLDITERKMAEDELKSKMEELERFNNFTINREERMIELKEEINQLCVQLGNPPKYKIVS